MITQFESLKLYRDSLGEAVMRMGDLHSLQNRNGKWREQLSQKFEEIRWLIEEVRHRLKITENSFEQITFMQAFNPLHTMHTHARETCLALGKPADDATLTAAIEAVGLENAARVLKLYPFEMSGGMLQRMMIAMAVLCESPFIIADEPTTDLDVVAQARILDLLESIMQKQAPGMLLVTHDMGVVARLADDVAVMSQGKIVEQGDVETLFNAPKHTVTRSLVSAHLALYGMELAS